MEQAQGARRTSKYVPVDIISSMPDNVITNIMDHLPILDAVRTSILSTIWRFKWTMITRIKEFTLTNCHETPLKLSSHLFSCLELKHLELNACLFHPIHSFRGFPNLLSLELYNVSFESCDFGEFLTQCPLLEILKISITTICKMKEAEIAKLKNLKVIWLPLCKLENMAMMTNSSVIQLTSLWPKLQKLKLDFLDCKLLEDGKTRCPNAFPCLKSLKLWRVDFSSEAMVSCAIELICSSPNLQSLEITARYNDEVQPSAVSFPKVDYSRIGQLQLRKVEFRLFRGSEIEICLIKRLLCFSPLLKKMRICCQSSEMFGGESGGRMFATKLLKFSRASPTVEIDLIWR
nr:hypothetical protein [Tanacetum cinerariifolium]